MKKWELQWEDILIQKLDKYSISSEKTSFSISSDLKKSRDLDWYKIIRNGQVVDLIQPKRKGGKVKLKAIDMNNLPIEIGTLNFFDEEVDYKKGIVCQLIDKELHYANGDTRSCLEFDQPIILIDSESIPKEILESKTLKINFKGKKFSGCLGVILLSIILIQIVQTFL